jgi:DNA-directed RNA polymerase specialized sigma24 family protein
MPMALSRERLGYQPVWDDGIEEIARVYLGRHVWRTLPEYDMDDLLQEAYLVCHRIKSKYPEMDSREHFERFFLRSLINMMNTLSSKKSRRKEVTDSVLGGEDGASFLEAFFDASGAEDRDLAEAEFRMLIADAPFHIRKLLEAVWVSGEYRVVDGIRETNSEFRERSSKKRSWFRRRGGIRETTNDFLCRRAGLPGEIDLRARLESWLEGGTPCFK